jgi:hypothetical protein
MRWRGWRTWTAALVAGFLILTSGASPALAGGGRHGGHGGFHGPRGHFHGRFFGPRFFVGPRFYPFYGYADPYYYPPYYYAPPPVVVTPPPTEYVERPPEAGYWYYCHDPAGYYPTVSSCPGGWTQVAPRSD